MEADISLCSILQFLIRQEDVSNQLINQVISSLPVEAENPRIRKELLIRGIVSDVSEGTLTESMLDSLESLEKLDREEGVYVSASMKRAYCGVALDCTVRYLEGLAFARGNYSQAVERIWRGRIRELESRNSELVTDELKAIMDDIEGAVWDVNVRKRLLGKCTRRDALKLTEVYLTEALAAMGRPFLELVAEKHVKKQRVVARDGQDSRDEVLVDIFGVDAEEEVAVENEEENMMAETNSGEDNQNEVVGTRGLDELDVIVVENEEDNKGDDVAKEDPIRVQSPCSNHEPDEDVGEDNNIVVEDPILAQPAHSNEEQDEQMHCGENGAEAEDLHNSFYNDGEGCTRKASETQAENSKAKLFPEVAKEDSILMQSPCSTHEPDEDVGEDNNIVLEDPILAQPAHSNEERDEQMHCGGNGEEAEDLHNSMYNDGEGSTRKAYETQAENSKAKKLTMDLVVVDDCADGQLFPEVAPRSKYDTLTTPAVNKLVESLRASSSALRKVVVDPLPDALRKAKAVQLEIAQDEHDSIGQAVDNEQRPTLMKPNATASSFEWDKSLDASQPRPHLDEPEAVSSLPKFSKRRAFSVEEEDALRKGVAKYGQGNWKLILANNIAVLGLRSTVDLKDKWRNMTRSPYPWLR